MRPRELTLHGFRSYTDEVTFDWSGRGLVGIVGPIGGGKSSILDAVTFALYGKTPRIERDTKSLINQRRDSMQVALSFEVDGQLWKAVRAIRRSGASSHALYRVDEDGESAVADKARDVSERVEALLGLDFDAFRRSVLLAQNQFATFLEATGTERNQVLKGVFGFERLDAMRAVTKERLDIVERSLATLTGRRASAESDAAELKEKQAHLDKAEEREKALEQLRTPFEEAKAAIAGAEAKAQEATGRSRRLGDLADRIPDRERTEQLFGAGAAGDARVAEAAERLRLAEADRVAAQDKRDKELQAAGGRQGLDEIAALFHDWRATSDRAGELEVAVASAEVEHDAAKALASEARSALAAAAGAEREAATIRDGAIAELEQARSRVDASQREHRAHALRVALSPGESCPVCLQAVESVPEVAVPASVESAESGFADAQQRAASTGEAAGKAAAEASEARAAAAGAAEAQAGAAKALESARQAVVSAGGALEKSAAVLTERLGEGDFEDLLAELRSGLEEAETRVKAATEAEDEARRGLAAAEDAAAQAAEALRNLRTEVAAVSGQLDLSLEVGDEADELRGALVALREAWISRQQAADGDKIRAEEEAEASRAALIQLLQAAGLGEGDDVVDVIAAARAERSAVEAEVQLLEKRLTELESLAGDESELLESAELLRKLHGDLAPSRFLEFVLDERRRALGDLASEHLEVLTGGRYRFEDTGEFLLVDLTAAGSIRSPASLSGGETFLASLALALALAEIVAREGGRLDAFFLDEGFGSLDPEHLDLAMDGVEHLVTSGPDRLVVIVSHVPALRERIEDLVVLDRDPTTGNTSVLAGRTAT